MNKARLAERCNLIVALVFILAAGTILTAGIETAGPRGSEGRDGTTAIPGTGAAETRQWGVPLTVQTVGAGSWTNLHGATVEVSGSDGLLTVGRTDSLGIFSCWVDLSEKPFTIRASAGGYGEAVSEVPDLPGPPTLLYLEKVPVGIMCRVLSRHRSAPIRGAEVHLVPGPRNASETLDGRANNAGVVEFGRVDWSLAWEMRVVADGYRTARIHPGFPAVAPGGKISTVVLLDPVQRVRIVVSGAPSGDVLAGSHVVFSCEETHVRYEGVSDGEGSIGFEIDPSRSWTLLAEAPGYLRAEMEWRNPDTFQLAVEDHLTLQALALPSPGGTMESKPTRDEQSTSESMRDDTIRKVRIVLNWTALLTTRPQKLNQVSEALGVVARQVTEVKEDESPASEREIEFEVMGEAEDGSTVFVSWPLPDVEKGTPPANAPVPGMVSLSLRLRDVAMRQLGSQRTKPDSAGNVLTIVVTSSDRLLDEQALSALFQSYFDADLTRVLGSVNLKLIQLGGFAVESLGAALGESDYRLTSRLDQDILTMLPSGWSH